MLVFYVGAGLEAGPHAHEASTSPTEPSPVFLDLCLTFSWHAFFLVVSSLARESRLIAESEAK